MKIDTNNCQFDITIIMSVYNTEKYLSEAVESVINQDFGFERIQLILLDDSSTDNSGKICDEYANRYPANVIVLHKCNRDKSFVRYDGIKMAKGRYLSFLDSDDLLAKETLLNAINFFDNHVDETDVIVIPTFFLGEKEDFCQLNDRFSKGSRVIDLLAEDYIFQSNLNATLIKRELVNRFFELNDNFSMAEEVTKLTKIILEKNKLGVVKEAGYFRRRKENNADSAIEIDPRMYVQYLKYFSDYILDYSKVKLGFIPGYIQEMVMHDLQCRLKSNSIVNAQNNDEIDDFYTLLRKILFKVEDKIILRQNNINNEVMFSIFRLKYGDKFKIIYQGDDILFVYNNDVITRISNTICKIEFINIHDTELTIEGTIQYYDFLEGIEDIELISNGYIYKSEFFKDEEDFCFLERKEIRYKRFRSKIVLSRNNDITIVVKFKNGMSTKISRYSFGNFSPISSNVEKSYYTKNGFIVYIEDLKIRVYKGNKRKIKETRKDYLKELWKRNDLGYRKAVIVRIIIYFCNLFKRKPIWLLSDRTVKADDNGLALFEFLQRKTREINSYFVISKCCNDYKRIKKIGKVVANGSFRHKILLLLSDYILSSQGEIEVYNPFVGHSEPYRNILSEKKFIFLQHGITKDDISSWLNKYNKNIYGFVTAAFPEYQSILNGKYYYDKDSIWLTGFPRFDLLYDDEKKEITIMPTWRKYLAQEFIRETGQWVLKPDFEKSIFYCFYNSLINNDRLINKANELGYKINFFPHPNLQDYIDKFDKNDSIRFLGRETNYKDVYANSSLMVTDYSSAVFDFAYLHKPVIYTHFDKDVFFAGGHVYKKGYFDYEENGFGEVEYNLDCTISRIIEYMESGCKLKDKYKTRIDNFFAYNDKNNCQRVYDRIKELEASIKE